MVFAANKCEIKKLYRVASSVITVVLPVVMLPDRLIGADRQCRLECTLLGKAPLPAAPPATLRDGSHLAYLTRKGSKAAVVADGVEGPPYDAITPNSLIFSSDGNRLAYAAMKGATWQVVLDGIEGPGYHAIATPIFSPDGMRVAYMASKGKKTAVLVNGVEGAEFDFIVDQGLAFRKGGVLEYLAIQENALYRVKQYPPGEQEKGDKSDY